MIENYYSVADVAARLNLSKGFVRELFRERPGVLRIGVQGRRAKRDYLTLRIPESVIQSFVAEISVPESRAGQRRYPVAVDARA